MTIHCLSRFHLLHPLGRKAGTVFHAEDLQLGRRVAVKLLLHPLCHDLRAVEELKRAADAIAALRHPRICAIEELDERDGQYFLVMELLEGVSLEERIASGPRPAGELLRVGGQVAEALEAGHGTGVVHGNLTPAKIFITDTGDVKLLDFCLVHILGRRGWRAHATPDVMAYAAPEELLDRAADARADLFSLGVVLYEMATGHKPFASGTPHALADAILHRTPPRALQLVPDLPPAVDWVIHRCLEKRPEQRYQSAGEVRADLARCAN